MNPISEELYKKILESSKDKKIVNNLNYFKVYDKS
tara:strand:- start:888 stop:992 length:105 start_codon:yes stop_codon:yes gene_type:complete